MNLEQQLRDLVDGDPPPHRLEDVVRRARAGGPSTPRRTTEPIDRVRRGQTRDERRTASTGARLAAAAAAVALLVAFAVPLSRWLRTSPDEDGRTVRAGTPEQATSTTVAPADIDPETTPGDPAAMAGATWTDVGTIDGVDDVELHDLPSGLWALATVSGDDASTGETARVLRSDDRGATWMDVSGDAFDAPSGENVHAHGIAEQDGVITIAGSRSHVIDMRAEANARHEAESEEEWDQLREELYRVRPVVWRSTDGGATWDPVELPGDSGVSGRNGSVLTVDTGFVVVSANAAWRSSDGESWELVSSFEDMTVSAATTFGERLVVVGYDQILDPQQLESLPRAMWSDDGGRTWERAAIDSDLEPTAGLALQSVAAGSDGLLAVGVRGIHGLAEDPLDFMERFGVRDPDESSGRFDVGVWFSADGRSWTERPPLGDASTMDAAGSVTWGVGGFLVEYLSIDVATNLVEAVHTATIDGSSWVPVRRDEFQDVASVAATAEGYVGAMRARQIGAAPPRFTVTRIGVP
ncbi:MAG: sialidase family protein [Actinomycetota bacterium]|nr:sialidase family protein [Actinomycetota bacterium]